MKILVVEDKAEVAHCLEMVLKELGHDITLAANSLEALNALGGHTFDVAVLDFELGGDTSAPVATLLMQRGIPFIVSSGRHSHELPAELSAAEYLRKPYVLEQLEAALRSCGLASGPEV